MKISYLEQRQALRLQLQHHRLVLSEQLNLAAEGENAFPRSMTMRLLTHRSNLSFLIVTEIFPQLLRYLVTRSGFKI